MSEPEESIFQWISRQYGEDVGKAAREIVAEDGEKWGLMELVQLALWKARPDEYQGAADGIVTGFNSD